jgi:hypothetical protein
MALTITTTQLQSELDGINAAITTYLATGVLPVSFSIPTGHSLDATNCLAQLYARRKELIEFSNTFDVPYLTSVGG